MGACFRRRVPETCAGSCRRNRVVHVSLGLRTYRASARRERKARRSPRRRLAFGTKSGEPCARHCTRTVAFDRVRPSVLTGLVSDGAGRVLARFGRGLLLSPANEFSKCQTCVGVRSCARRTWLVAGVGLVSAEGCTARRRRLVGACSVLPDPLDRMSPLGQHEFDRGSEPPKSQRLSGRADLRSAPVWLDRSSPSGGSREDQAGTFGLPGAAEEMWALKRFAPP